MQQDDREDVIALTYAGAFLIERCGKPISEVRTTLNDRRAQKLLVGQLIASSAWRNEWAPWLRTIYDAFAAIGYERRNQTIRRVLPGLAAREVVDVGRDEHGEISRTTRTTADPLANLDLQEQFFLLVRGVVRHVAEKRDLRSVMLAMLD